MKKNIILIILIAAITLIVASIGISYAIYTHSSVAQRVIAPYDMGERFSSNLLKKGSAGENVKTAYSSDPENINPLIIATISNFPQGKQTQYNKEDLSYTVSFRLVSHNEGTYLPISASGIENGYEITISRNLTDSLTLNKNNLSGSLSGTLTGNQSSTDVLHISFTGNFATNKPNVYLEVVVTPSDPFLPTLSGIFKADVRVEGETNHWSGEITDNKTIGNPADYDGFNYLISGFGKGIFTLNWNTDYVDIAYKGLDEILSIDGAMYTINGTTATLTFNVNSSDTARYEIQFYKVNITNETWDELASEENAIITYSFME